MQNILTNMFQKCIITTVNKVLTWYFVYKGVVFVLAIDSETQRDLKELIGENEVSKDLSDQTIKGLIDVTGDWLNRNRKKFDGLRGYLDQKLPTASGSTVFDKLANVFKDPKIFDNLPQDFLKAVENSVIIEKSKKSRDLVKREANNNFKTSLDKFKSDLKRSDLGKDIGKEQKLTAGKQVGVVMTNDLFLVIVTMLVAAWIKSKDSK